MSIKQQLAGVEIKSGTRPRNVANNTVEYTRPDGAVCIRLHATDVIVANADGSVTLNSGGWRTVTTKDRINAFQRLGRVWQERGEWSVSVNGTTHAYADGITIHPDGKVDGAGRPTDKALIKSIRAYAKAFAAALPVPPPSNGDCFGCLFAEAGSTSPYSYPLAQGHLLEHIRENYFVPSLLARVLKEQNCGALYYHEAFGEGSTFLACFRPRIAQWLFRHIKAVVVDGRKA